MTLDELERMAQDGIRRGTPLVIPNEYALALIRCARVLEALVSRRDRVCAELGRPDQLDETDGRYVPAREALRALQEVMK